MNSHFSRFRNRRICAAFFGFRVGFSNSLAFFLLILVRLNGQGSSGRGLVGGDIAVLFDGQSVGGSDSVFVGFQITAAIRALGCPIRDAHVFFVELLSLCIRERFARQFNGFGSVFSSTRDTLSEFLLIVSGLFCAKLRGTAFYFQSFDQPLQSIHLIRERHNPFRLRV